jgi:phage terminase large subunit
VKLIPPNKTINISFTPLQDKAWNYLVDNETNIVLFGGSSGCGKTFLGCSWIVLMCIQYPGIVCGATRARIIDFRKSTQITLLNVLKSYGFVEGINYTFDRQVNIIQLYNQSKIIIFDSYYYASDPLYERLSSIELTFCLLDEASQISARAMQIIQTRLRYKHFEYKLIPKILIVTNPCNNHIKKDIYTPFINGTLEPHIKVVLGLVQDNPYIDKSYKENLERLDTPTKQRLLYGDWDYSSSDDSLFDQEQLVNIFYNTLFINNDNNKYICVDIASSGNDKSVITIWKGLECFDIQVYQHKTIPQLYEIIKHSMGVHGVNINNVVVDKSGVGVGLFDLLKGCKGFIANEKPTINIYGMLKDELWYKFADYVNNGRIKISFDRYKDEIVQELGAHTMYKYDQDNNKTQVLPKDKVKSLIGRSPDIADSIVMRMYFEVKQTGFSFTII